MAFYSCPMIAGLYLNINGRIDTGERVLTLCCENVPKVPAVAFADTAEETLERFLGMRTLMAAEGLKAGSAQPPQNSRFDCAKCDKYRPADWSTSLLISYVNLSMYPAPCQCRCIYCDAPKKWRDSPETSEAYEKLFAMLKLAKNTGAILPNASWQVSTGEISIHPYKERIINLLRGQRTVFYTNAFIFDKGIAQNLHDNPGSAINLSIDAGTAETWHKVKGFDNFSAVLNNLAMYRDNSARPGQITLKYIILPDVNDFEHDYAALMEISQDLGVQHLTISRNTDTKYSLGKQGRRKLINAAARLLIHCQQNKIGVDMFTYTADEQAATINLANELLRSNGAVD